MQYGIGIDATLGLTFAEQRTLAREAKRAGYTSAWTPSGSITRDGFQVCAQWHGATADDPGGGLVTGIAVIPAPTWTVTALASQAGTLSDLTGGRFILGLGTGGIYGEDYRQRYGMSDRPVVGVMRDYLTVLRRLLAGETVTHEGRAITVHELQMGTRPLQVPLYLAALGPQMSRLAGELSDGVSLNWSTPAQRRWGRERIAEGAAKARRPASSVQLMEYIRVCVDDDVDAARRAFVRAFMGYALARPGAPKTSGYRGHFTRLGFDDTLTAIEGRRDAGASEDELLDLFPEDVLRQMGYYGRASGAAAALVDLAKELDTAVVRIVGARPGLTAARAVMEACSPARVAAGPA